MRKSNKVISAMLSVLMVSGMFTAMPLVVNAAGTADTNETTTSAAVQSADDTQSDSEENEYNDFTYYTYFNEENNRTEAVITGYKGIDNDLVIPDSIDNAVVTSIGVKAFAESNQFESITIPDSIESIGEDAFWECNGLKKVYVSSIEDWCKIKFENTFSNPINYGSKIYIDGELATDITIPKGITKICDYAFANCETITNVVIPNSVISIGNSAFSLCSNLKNINIPNSVVNIGEGAFSSCSNLEEVEIPDGIKFIKDFTFVYCENLTTIIIPQSVKEIGSLAFYSDSSNLSNVLFKGSKSQWNSIDFTDGNTNLVESVIHYDVKLVEKKSTDLC